MRIHQLTMFVCCMSTCVYLKMVTYNYTDPCVYNEREHAVHAFGGPPDRLCEKLCVGRG